MIRYFHYWMKFCFCLCQITLGICTLLYFVPTSLAAAHQSGSLTLLSLALWFAHELRRIPKWTLLKLTSLLFSTLLLYIPTSLAAVHSHSYPEPSGLLISFTGCHKWPSSGFQVVYIYPSLPLAANNTYGFWQWVKTSKWLCVSSWKRHIYMCVWCRYHHCKVYSHAI